MKILFVLEYYYPNVGGVETLFKTLAESLVKKGYECKVLTSKVNDSSEFETINGVEIYRINVPKFADRYFFSFYAIPQAVKLGKWADIIHTTTYTASFPAYVSAKLNKKKSIITVHEVFMKMWKNFPISKLSSFINKNAEKFFISLNFNKYVCVSDYTRNCLRLMGKKDSKLITIHNGLDYNEITIDKKINIKDDLKLKNTFVYLYYGRPGITKGPENLILAVKIVKENILNSKLVMILSKNPYNRYKQMLNIIKTNNLEQDIIILDSMDRKKLFSYIKTSDCIVVPSLSEGFGFCVAESNYISTPVIATNVASIPEVISNKYILIPPNSPEDIANAIIKVKNNKFSKSELKLFPLSESVKKYEEVYQELR